MLSRIIPDTALTIGYLLGFLLCSGLLGAAYYFEYQLYLDPCPLCIVQRILTLVIGLFCLFAFFLRRSVWPLRISMIGVLLTSLAGIWVTNHHIWIQGLPPEEVPECGPGLAYMIDTLSVNELLTALLKGDGSCAEISWTFMSLSMPQWMLLVFSGFLMVSMLGILRTWKHKS